MRKGAAGGGGVGRDQDAREALTQGSDQGHSRGVLVDMKWTDINPDKDGTRRHGRHFLLATGVVNDGGQEWYRLENPIGDYIKGKGSAGTLERSYAPGTVLGEKNSVWWKAGENGIVYVRKDVMEKNLVTVMVQYDTQYNASMEKPVTLLGTLKTQGTTYDAPIDFIRPTPRKVEPEQQKARAIIDKGSVAKHTLGWRLCSKSTGVSPHTTRTRTM